MSALAMSPVPPVVFMLRAFLQVLVRVLCRGGDDRCSDSYTEREEVQLDDPTEGGVARGEEELLNPTPITLKSSSAGWERL
jgi:hypothetical protein